MRAQEIQPTKLVIFDIDDTLVHTQTRVHVIKDGRIVRSLNSHEFTHYQLQPGESFDFGDFADAREFFEKARPIIPMINQLKQDINTGNKVVMVTARADFNDKELFLDTFRKYGIDMNRVHVYRAGNNKQRIPTETKKQIIISDLLKKHPYNKAIMYDDAVPNLESFVALKQEYPNTKFYAWHVSLDGQATEYQRTNEATAHELFELNYPDELNVSDALQQYFVKRGYQVAGEGRDQIAFKSPRGTVVKVLGLGDHNREQVVRDYVAFFVRNQRNPYYPRIYNTGEFPVGDETYFVYEQEYLNFISDEEAVLEYIEDLMSAVPHGEQAVHAFQQNRPLPKSLNAGEVDGLVMATQDLEDYLGGTIGGSLDLSMIENIRRRPDGHLVIMDPYSL